MAANPAKQHRINPGTTGDPFQLLKTPDGEMVVPAGPLVLRPGWETEFDFETTGPSADMLVDGSSVSVNFDILAGADTPILMYGIMVRMRVTLGAPPLDPVLFDTGAVLANGIDIFFRDNGDTTTLEVFAAILTNGDILELCTRYDAGRFVEVDSGADVVLRAWTPFVHPKLMLGGEILRATVNDDLRTATRATLLELSMSAMGLQLS